MAFRRARVIPHVTKQGADINHPRYRASRRVAYVATEKVVHGPDRQEIVGKHGNYAPTAGVKCQLRSSIRERDIPPCLGVVSLMRSEHAANRLLRLPNIGCPDHASDVHAADLFGIAVLVVEERYIG